MSVFPFLAPNNAKNTVKLNCCFRCLFWPLKHLQSVCVCVCFIHLIAEMALKTASVLRQTWAASAVIHIHVCPYLPHYVNVQNLKYTSVVYERSFCSIEEGTQIELKQYLKQDETSLSYFCSVRRSGFCDDPYNSIGLNIINILILIIIKIYIPH